MSQTLSDIYNAKCISLAATMVIHHPPSASIINDELKRLGYTVDVNKPATWKYYLNLAGYYHQYDLDVIAQLNSNQSGYMQINVAGDKGPVAANFTRELISGQDADLAVANEYQYGSRYYKELVAKYPDHRALINGILNPIDLDVSVYAEQGDILYAGGYYRTRLPGLASSYGFVKSRASVFEGSELIEEWEYSLLPNLEKMIKNYFKHYDNSAYRVNHGLYTVVNLGELYLQVVTQVMKLRLANCRTYEAHSYHVSQFLDSHGGLGKYVNYLTRQQYMFLYKNIDYLEANLGKQKIFDLLMDNILTPQGIPLAGYRLRHNVEELVEVSDSEPFFEREHLNFKQLGAGSDRKTIPELLEICKSIAKGNAEDLSGQEEHIKLRALMSSSNDLNTKLLESNLINWGDDYYYSQAEFMFNNWLYAVSQGSYRGTIYATNPQTGDRIQLTPKNAFALMLYCFYRGYYNISLTEYPNVFARMVAKPKRDYPSFVSLRTAAVSPFVSDQMIIDLRYGLLPDHIYSSANNFYTKTLQMHELLMQRFLQTQACEEIDAAAQMEFLLSRLYYEQINLPKLFTGSYATWLDTLGIEFSNFSKASYQSLADELLLEGQGIGASTDDYLINMHRSLIEIMRKFSSYDVCYVQKTSVKNVHNLGSRNFRLGDFKETVAAITDIDILRAPIATMKQRRYNTANVEFNDLVVLGSISSRRSTMNWDIPSIGLTHQATNYISNVNVLSPLVYEVTDQTIPAYQNIRYLQSQMIHNQIKGQCVLALEATSFVVEVLNITPQYNARYIEVDIQGLTPLSDHDVDFNLE